MQTDGDNLRRYAGMVEDNQIRAVDRRLIAKEMVRMAKRLDEWDKELAHIAVENDDNG